MKISFSLVPIIDYSRATVNVGTLGSSVTMLCNAWSLFSNSSVWLTSKMKTGLYEVHYTVNKYSIDRSNGNLFLSSLSLSDEDYYICGYSDTFGNFFVNSIYYLFIQGNLIEKILMKYIERVI
jgi:hypothetical protein